MLQVLYIGVTEIDRDVIHVAMGIHVCFKYMFGIGAVVTVYKASGP
jgi:hypothetical protein